MITTLTSRSRTISAEYMGGAYIELSFAGSSVPFEVINVYDYAKGESTLWTEGMSPQTRRAALRQEVSSWIDVQDSEWPEWYKGYMENTWRNT